MKRMEIRRQLEDILMDKAQKALQNFLSKNSISEGLFLRSSQGNLVSIIVDNELDIATDDNLNLHKNNHEMTLLDYVNDNYEERYLENALSNYLKMPELVELAKERLAEYYSTTLEETNGIDYTEWQSILNVQANDEEILRCFTNSGYVDYNQARYLAYRLVPDLEDIDYQKN